MVLLPILIVLSTLLFLLVLFIICALILRKRRGILLSDRDGPVDLSREDLMEGAGGFAGVESRWLESVTEDTRRSYQQAKDWQLQYPPNSLPTDITLSQFLSIQEKGVSAWCFEPDYETMPSLLVHARTELTFLPDPSSSSTVQSNLPLPKLNEVYYWEVKMFDLPESTTVSVGLATKPYPPFRLPGLNRFSIAYHSNGDKSYNYPFTATPFGPPLKEGDVLGVGYRPRSGTVFFTRNGRKTEDAFVGLGKWNLFPSIGADGPCSVHVNLGQAGFVHIEANVKKWGLAPSVGTLAPPPAYGSERGSILLEAGGANVPRSLERPRSPPPPIDEVTPSASTQRSSGRRPHNLSTSSPLQPSPLRGSPFHHRSPSHPGTTTEGNPPEDVIHPGSPGRYISPTDMQYHSQRRHRFAEGAENEDDDWRMGPDRRSRSPLLTAGSDSSTSRTRSNSTRRRNGETPVVLTDPSTLSSPEFPNPPTPHLSDIHLREMHSNGAPPNSPSPLAPSMVEPPAYTIVDAARYPDGVTVDIPPEILAAALEDRPSRSSHSR
ncbi:hypothetical protein BS47DRAFT_1345000 [Hydnum rufescens UP504]|uniref:B30.2/SPRY domain-containing protein n=1 Tax=Hydnum rufescens UP504 TaxID=1448309 RepID=A0A9P6AW41_9AGAM|nr:hypothetical protein BS47DRAFT_1345000 [Hydnum rufescens UP504]